MNFKLVVQNLDGSQKWELPNDSWSFTETLNKGASGNVTFSEQSLRAIGDVFGIDPDFILMASYREVYILDDAGNTIFGGYIGDINSSRDVDGAKNRSIAVNSWLELLEARFRIHPDDDPRVIAFTNEYAKTIIQEVITHTQALDYGDLGFTFGSMPNDVRRDRTIRFETIKEILEKLSGDDVINGVDMEITPTKVINTYYPKKGADKPNLPLIDGVNIRSYSTHTNFINQMCNEVFVFGEGNGDDMVVEDVASTDPVKAQYFLLQRGLQEKGTSLSANLIAKGQAYIAKYELPVKLPSVVIDYESPLVTEYDLGDNMPVVIPDENIDGLYRLRQRTINSTGEVTLSFDSEA